MEIRSVDTCIGLGEFSKILDTSEVESAKSQIPPTPINVKVDLVSTTPARMRWKPPTVAEFLSYVINYWKIGSISLSAKKETTRCGCTSYQLEGLESETTYQLNICTIADDGWRNKSSGNFEFTTTETFRFAETFVRRCQKIGRYDGLDLHQIPLSKVTAGRLSTAADLFTLDVTSRPSKQRTILLVGVSGSSKRALINAMMNYIDERIRSGSG